MEGGSAMAPSYEGLKGPIVMALWAGAFLIVLVLAGNPGIDVHNPTQVSNHAEIRNALPFQAVSAGEPGYAQPTGLAVTLPAHPGGEGPTPTDFPFGHNIRVWGDPNNQSRADIVVNATGTIFITFQHYNGVDWDVFITSSTDEGHAWNAPVALANTTANETNPSIALNSRGAYALFYQQDGFSDRLYFFQSTDGVLWRQGFWVVKPGLSDPQLPDVAAQTPTGMYPDGIMVTVQVRCVHPTNCIGGSDTSYWVGSSSWSAWPPAFDLANWYWGAPGAAFPPQFLRPSISWSDAALYQVLENVTTPGAKWSFITFTMFENGTGLIWTYHSWVNSTAMIFPDIASDGIIVLVGGSYVNATLFPSNPTNHNAIYFFSMNAGAGYLNGSLDSSATNQLSISVAGKGTEWHFSYYSDSIMTHQVSYDSMATLSGPQKVSDNAGTAASDVLSTAIYLERSGVPQIAWQDNRDGDANIYFSTNLAYHYWINASCGGADANLKIAIDGTLYETPLAGLWTPGGLHTIDVLSPQPSGPCKRCVFRRWSDGGGNPRVVNATSDIGLLAELDDSYLVRLAEDPPLPLLNITWNGTTYQGPTQLFERPGTYAAAVPTPQQTAPDVRFNFTEWSDGDTSNPRTVVVPQPGAGCVNLTALFLARYLITIDTFPSGIGLMVGYDTTPMAIEPVSFWADDGSTHMLITFSKQGGGPSDTRYKFNRWAAPGPNTWGWNVTISGPATYTAVFTRQFRFYVMSNIPGPLFNIDADCGIALPAEGPLTCWGDELYVHTIEAISPPPNPCRLFFMQWNDGNINPIRNADKGSNATYVAFFELQCSLTVRIDPGSCWDAGPPMTSWYGYDQPVILGWTPPTGLPLYERYRFHMWVGEGDGSYTGPNPNGMVTIRDEITETAYCYHEFMTAVEAPTSVFYYVDDVNYTGLQTFWWLNRTMHWLNVTVTTQIGSMAGTRYIFMDWSGVDFSPLPHHPPIIALASTAGMHFIDFKIQYLVTLVSPAKGNLRCLENASCWYDVGAQATVSVTTPWPSGTDSIRYAFQHWMGDASGTDTDFVISSVDAPKTIGAEWADEYKLGVLTDQSSASCSPNSDCWFFEGTFANVTLADSIAPGSTGTRYLFNGWTGDVAGLNPFPLLMNSPKNITTTWRTQYQLTVTSTCGSDAGCGALYGGGWFNASTLASLSVTTPWTDSSGKVWDFDYWGGDAGGSQTTTLVTMDAPKNVTAVWKERPGESPWALLIGVSILAIAVVLVAIFVFLRTRRKKKDKESGEKGAMKAEDSESEPKTSP